ncbi:MAG: nitroreductase family protein [Alphaproteobacteria bacterium]|jgi:nitroreductase
MELNDVMQTTFAAREFTDDPLSDDVLFEILDIARFAPSGGNRQGNRVIIVRDQETKIALSDLARPAAKRYTAQIKAGESPWQSVYPTKVTEAEIEATEPSHHLTQSFIRAQVVLVFVVDLGKVASMDQFLDRVGVISGASIYPFVWNTLMAARQAGFGGTITTLAAAQEPKVQKLLNIPGEFAVAAVVPMGKPIKQLSKLRRNAVEEIATLETFDGAKFRKI